MDSDYLFITEVGSRMWGMEHSNSDYDMFHVYQQSASDYLRSGTFEKTRASKSYTDHDRIIDAQYMEIGHLINLLKKGNVNAIWAVCSCVIHKDSESLKQLKHITLQNLSKQSYHSIKGMTMSELSDVRKRAAVRDPQKNLRTCKRTLEFGHSLLLGGGVNLSFVNRDVTEEECKKGTEDLDKAFEISKLPCSIDSRPFDNFIYRLRMGEIVENNIEIKIK